MLRNTSQFQNGGKNLGPVPGGITSQGIHINPGTVLPGTGSRIFSPFWRLGPYDSKLFVDHKFLNVHFCQFC
jgi:hypothetical protein